MKKNIAILGSGNIGSDLMIKIKKYSKKLELLAIAGINKNSDGLKLAQKLGIWTTDLGLNGILNNINIINNIDIIFDATSASSHIKHDKILKQYKKIQIIDLTPAAIGPYIVPTVNILEYKNTRNINMVTCGGQATIPIVYAISRITPVLYAEIIATIASRSAGPGTRANIDEFTKTTARAIEIVGKAQKGKAIIILNPAIPSIIMRDTIYCLIHEGKEKEIEFSIHEMIKNVCTFVPGYSLKQKIQFKKIYNPFIKNIDEQKENLMVQVSVLLEIEGAADYLPKYAGNLDIMTSSAIKTAEAILDK